MLIAGEVVLRISITDNRYTRYGPKLHLPELAKDSSAPNISHLATTQSGLRRRHLLAWQ